MDGHRVRPPSAGRFGDSHKEAANDLAMEVNGLRRKLTQLRQAIPNDMWDEIVRSHYHMSKWFDEHRVFIDDRS